MANPELDVVMQECSGSGPRQWIFTTQLNNITYRGVFEIENLPEDSYRRRFLEDSPAYISENFNKGNYTIKITPKYILLVLMLEHILKSVEVFLFAQ